MALVRKRSKYVKQKDSDKTQGGQVARAYSPRSPTESLAARHPSGRPTASGNDPWFGRGERSVLMLTLSRCPQASRMNSSWPSAR